MALTKEQFSELRKQGLSVDQIVKFDERQKPEKKGIFERVGLVSPIERVKRTAGIVKKAGEFAFGTTAGLTKKFGKTVEENIRELGGQRVTQKEGLSIIPGEGKKLGLGESAGALLETTPLGTGAKAVKAGAKIAKKPLTLIAEKLFRSALKPRDVKKGGKIITKAEEIVRTGLKERVWLTKGGVEAVSSKIDNLEGKLGDAIEAGKAAGKTIKTAGLKEYIDTAKDFFKDQVNVKEASKAIKEIDGIFKNFVAKYGKEVPIEQAQRIKVKTGQALRKYYNTMSSARIEGEKQAVRGLKEQIVKEVPAVGDINKRLSDLFKFDQALSKASGRIGNLNLLGLPSKIGGAVGGPAGVAKGKLLEVLDSASVKSGLAIGINELTRGGGKAIEKGRVPVSLIIANLLKLFKND